MIGSATEVARFMGYFVPDATLKFANLRPWYRVQFTYNKHLVISVDQTLASPRPMSRASIEQTPKRSSRMYMPVSSTHGAHSARMLPAIGG